MSSSVKLKMEAKQAAKKKTRRVRRRGRRNLERKIKVVERTIIPTIGRPFPAIKKNTVLTKMPSSNGTRVVHSEYVGSVNSSSTLVVDSYPINPGNEALFPWLSGIAVKYETYVIHGIRFEFRSLAGSAVSAPDYSLGKVMLMYDLDPTDAPPVDEASFLSNAYVVSSKISKDCVLPVECDPSLRLHKRYFVRQPTEPMELVTADYGNLHVGTVGSTGVSRIGDLWVSYDIEFNSPSTNFSPIVGHAIHFYGNTPTDEKNSRWTGGTPIIHGPSSIGERLKIEFSPDDGKSGGGFKFGEVGNYLLSYVTTAVGSTFTDYVNFDFGTGMSAEADEFFGTPTPSLATGVKTIRNIAIAVNTVGAILRLNGSGWTSGAGQWQALFTKLSDLRA